MKLVSFNYAETVNPIVNAQFAASGLGTARFTDVFPGVVNDIPVMFARVEYSWTGVTGGDGTSALVIRGHVLTANPASVPAAGSAAVNMYSRIGTAATAFNGAGSTSVGMGGAGPAAGGEYIDIANFPAANATGGLVPFPLWWTLRISNGATAWTGGTLTINSVKLYG